jgi:DNA-binding NarL/FixJ family response regulator
MREVIDELEAGLATVGITICPLKLKELATDSVDPAPVILPGMTEDELLRLGTLRSRSNCRSIIAVVDDPDGNCTFRAIRAGASRVLNSRIPLADRISSLIALFEEADPPTAEAAPLSDREHILLIQLLCGPDTIPAIARRFYCSERSMHRRIRRIYDIFGVSGRTELRSFVSSYPEISPPNVCV